MLKDIIRNIFRTFGYDISSFHHAYHPLARRRKLMEVHNIDTVLDVGANTGQYGSHLRAGGYKGKIISFEPLHDAYEALLSRANIDPAWSAFNLALGDFDGDSEINVSANSCSSSLLGMLPDHEKSAPHSIYIGKETVKINRLDTIFGECCGDSNNLYMKVDTQGYGEQVLSGARKSLERISGIQMEVSLVQLYENEALIEDIVGMLRQRGFAPMSIEPGFGDQVTGQLLQADFVFFRI